jgi:glycerophosphoryl diester phosphodiesterase
MEENDPKYNWGYREDVFYKRAFEYIQENRSDKRNFIYLEVGPTNHWPHAIPSDFEGSVPFPEPKNFKERLSNTMYIQDHHLKTAWDELNKMFPDGNYTLFILSDHGWPIGMHKGNIFNERGGFEENFLTSMALVVGNHKELKEKKVEEKYSLMDIMPTLAELLDISLPKSDYYRSFAHVFSNEQKHEQKKNRTILIQPFSSKFLNIIEGDMKYQYNSKNDQLLAYNLSDDPEESYPNILSQSSKKNIGQISKLLPLFENRNIIMHAMGGIDGRTYTNSREAFQEHYDRGRRVFEVDLALTKDEQVVASHSKRVNFTQEEFLGKKIYGIYTSLSLANILDLMVKFPDMILVTDTKDDFPEIISKIVDLAKQKDETLLDRVIPQIYSEDSYYEAVKTYSFNRVIYTLYQNDVSDDEVVKFIRKVDNIYAVTMSLSRFSKKSVKKINDAAMRVFVHTLNGQKEIEKFSRNGVDGIYTDYY